MPSTLLWSRLLTDVEANAPWQRLRRSLLLLLQLLLVLILALLAARPFLERPAGLARDIVLVVDTSASMAADGRRADPARRRQGRRHRRPARPADRRQGQRHRRRPDRPDRRQRDRRTSAGSGRPSTTSSRRPMPGDLGDALELASKLAARSGDAQILVATDAALASRPDGQGRRAGHGPAGRPRPQEPGDRRARRPDRAVGRDPLGLRQRREPRPRVGPAPDRGLGRRPPPRGPRRDRSTRRPAPTSSSTTCPTRSGRSRSASSGATRPSASRPDQLAIDDRAWAVIPPDRTRLILLVGEGDPYLETALSYLPERRAVRRHAGRVRAESNRDGRAAVGPGHLRGRPAGDPAGQPDPGHRPAADERRSARSTARSRTRASARSSPDEPILRYVDLSTTHIAEATKLVLPDWARTVIPGPKGAPLLYAGDPGRPADGGPRLRAAPVRPAAPGRASRSCSPTSPASCSAARPPRPRRSRPGTPVTLTIPTGRDRPHRRAAGRLRRPSSCRPPRAARASRSPRTELLGHLHGHADPGRGHTERRPRPAAPDRPPAPPPGASAGTGAGASAEPPAGGRPVRARPVRGRPLRRRRIDDRPRLRGRPRTARDRARCLPRPGRRHRVRPPPRATSCGSRSCSSSSSALCVEWAVYHRDALIRLRRSLGARFGRAVRGRERLMGVSFDAPLALLLLIPALALTVVLHLGARRRMGAGRRRVALVVRSLLLAALVFALAGFQLVLPVDRLATVFVVDLSDSVGNAGREDALAFLRETLKEKPEGDVAGIVAFGKDALVERLPSDLEEIDRIASTPVKSRDRHRGGAAARLGAVPRRRPEADRPPLRRQRHDRRRPGRGRARGRPRASRSRRAGSASAPSTRSSSSGSRRRRPPASASRSRPSSRSARRSPSRPRSACSPTARWSRPSRSSSRPGSPGSRSTSRRPRPGSTRSGPSSRRPATRSARTTGPTRTPSSRASRGRSSSRATTTWRRSSSRRSRTSASTSTRSSPRRSRPTSPSLATYDSVVLVDVPRLRLSDRQLAALQVYVRDLGKGLVMVGGPRSYGAGGYQKTAARGDAAGRHGRARPREAARHRARRRHRPVRLDGRLPLQHVRRRGRRRDRHRRRPEGRHRQGGDPARRGGA